MTPDTAALSECPQCSSALDPNRAEEILFCSVCRFPLMLVAGKYRLEHVLSEGGVGVLYLARHIGLTMFNERVIKVLKPSLFEKQSAKERFRREVQVTANLSENNVHIVRIYDDFGEEPQLGPYYVMEYLRGKSLDRLMEEEQALTHDVVFHIFYQLCNAIGAAHRAGIIHRDLKPENIFLISRDQNEHFVKIIDFGLARPTDSQSNITQGIFGTPAYMSPEQCQGMTVDERTDIYSMGMILYELLSGELPYLAARAETMSLLVAHLSQEPRPLLAWRPDLPQGLEDALFRALAKDPGERYATAEEFWEAVAPYATSSSTEPNMSAGARARAVSGEPVFLDPAMLGTGTAAYPSTRSAAEYVEVESFDDSEDDPTFVADSSFSLPPPPPPVDPNKTLAQESVPEELLRQALLGSEQNGAGGKDTEIGVLAIADDGSPQAVDLESLLVDDVEEREARMQLLASMAGLDTSSDIPAIRSLHPPAVASARSESASGYPRSSSLHPMLDTDPTVLRTDKEDIEIVLLDDVATAQDDSGLDLNVPKFPSLAPSRVSASEAAAEYFMAPSLESSRMADLHVVEHNTRPDLAARQRTGIVLWLAIFLFLSLGIISVAVFLILR